ncbi:hypothetical protein K402DRAFT_331040 [Aulographum hederae CBS 113979]|uniref:Uncharacterized protein n=1 Tax=Aulographum hederae CBS 113979 TaxID=1176131 RepID=A0A6G1H2M0_9PEZI|nr:hypothetical protein K402DRAFT_331040 [Aulographum hederae CBS 113979]
MDVRIARLARDADDAASGLQIFADEIPERYGEISGNISEFVSLGEALRDLDRTIELELDRFGPLSGIVKHDIDLLLRSLQYTMKLITQMFEKTYMTKHSGSPPYRMLWDDLCERVSREEPRPLPSRLEFYSAYIQTVLDALNKRRGTVRIEDMRNRINPLLARQDPRKSLHIDFGKLHLNVPDPARTPRPRPTTPMARPPMASFASFPPFPGHPSMPTPNPFVPPPVPEAPAGAPLSPTFSNSSQQTFSSGQTWSSTSSGQVVHWAQRIFDGRHSMSPLHHRGRPTGCAGSAWPEAIERLQSEGFIQLMRIPAEDVPMFNIKLYYRPFDHRARLLLSTKDGYGRPLRYCIPLTSIKLQRENSSLLLWRRRDDGKLGLWGSLHFAYFERMALFYATFVSMKKQDQAKILVDLQDYFPGEKEEFGGEIADVQLLHAFRIFRDRDSGCVRFEASARRGAMIGTPIWTAFVTQYLQSPQWMRRINHRAVELDELRPYVFCKGYKPPKSPSGKYMLQFTSRKGMMIWKGTLSSY